MDTAELHTDLERMPEGGKAYWRSCADGTRIRVAVWQGSGDKTVLVFPGRTEFIEKYGDVTDRLLDRGYSVAVVDWRGQGLSDRHPVHPPMGWVKEFSDYQLDVAEVLATVRDTGLPDPYAMIAHSMGGAIGLRALLDGLPVEKAIFSAPMWDIYVASHMRVPAWIVSTFGPGIGLGQRFVPTGGPTNYVQEQPFEGNALTNDEASYKVMQSHIAQHPEMGLGGPSVHWLNRAKRETRALIAAAPPPHDCLCFLGSKESIVSKDAIRKVMGKWPNGQLVELEGAQHEVLMEEPHVLKQVWLEIDAHLDE
ncbi:alpha/beta hydrolase [Neptunicoccus sediminis]|uniref:alpha/beta hydrolase n=1 Tax=Neptunicoccus sediminis TaxID=1892596 RepID=UPI0008460B63|nr:alpha/beta hydrolase [Neptunicoccus sediminis]